VDTQAAKARLKDKRIKAKIWQRKQDGVPSKEAKEYVLGSASE